MVGDASCHIIYVADSEIYCYLGPNRAGQNNVHVNREGFGLANSDIIYKYDLRISTLSQTEGDIFNQFLIVLNGRCPNTTPIFFYLIFKISTTQNHLPLFFSNFRLKLNRHIFSI